MKCPVCGNTLEQNIFEGITVDICSSGCRGVWFDNFELKKVDEAHEAVGEALLDVRGDPSVAVDRSKSIECPKCDGMTMRRHFFSVKRQVEVDECPNCAGYWLDSGELGTIRSQFATEEQREQAAKMYFSELYDEQLVTMREENAASRERAGDIARMFRFICPSNYIPGKQEWGAF